MPGAQSRPAGNGSGRCSGRQPAPCRSASSSFSGRVPGRRSSISRPARATRASSPRRSSGPAAGSSPPTSPRRCSTRRAAARLSSASTTSSSGPRTSPPSRSTMPPSTGSSAAGASCSSRTWTRRAAEIRRVLRADGRAALAVWGSPDDNDWMTAPGRSALELGLVERPDPAAPGPFRLSAERRARGGSPRRRPHRRDGRRGAARLEVAVTGRLVGRGEGHVAHAFDAARASEPGRGAGGA